MENHTIKFLQDASNILKNTNDSPSMGNIICQLSHNYLNAVTVSGNQDGKFNSFQFCKCCGNAWADGLFKFHVLGHKHDMKKRKAKFEQKSELSSCMKRYLSFYRKRKDNIMVKKCLVCKAITKCGMNKPNKKEQNGSSVLNDSCSSLIKGKRKKKRKTNDYYGLSPAAVIQAKLSSGLIQLENNKGTNILIDKKNAPIGVPVEKPLDTSSSEINLKINNLIKSIPKTVSSENGVAVLNSKTIKSNSQKKKLKKIYKKNNISKQDPKKKKSFVAEFLANL